MITEKMDLNRHIESIRKRMDLIPGLIIDNFGLSSHLGEKLSPGCRACKDNKWTVVFIGNACNCKCYFCPQTHAKPVLGSKADNNGIVFTSYDSDYFLHLLIRIKNAAAKKSLLAIGYGGGEPLLYIERIKQYAREITALNSGLYQYVYTNGKLVTKSIIQELREVGIQEVRFNLAATDFSQGIINKMERARKIIPFLTIEIPVLKDTVQKLRKNIERFIDIGVDQICLSEVIINSHNERYFKDEPCYSAAPISLEDIKSGKKGVPDILRQQRYPIWSRNVTYDVMEIAAKEKWPIVINDCSMLNHIKPHELY